MQEIENQTQILSLLKQEEPLSTKIISQKTGIDIDSVKEIINSLKQEDIVVSVGRGRGTKYTLFDNKNNYDNKRLDSNKPLDTSLDIIQLKILELFDKEKNYFTTNQIIENLNKFKAQSVRSSVYELYKNEKLIKLGTKYGLDEFEKFFKDKIIKIAKELGGWCKSSDIWSAIKPELEINLFKQFLKDILSLKKSPIEYKGEKKSRRYKHRDCPNNDIIQRSTIKPIIPIEQGSKKEPEKKKSPPKIKKDSIKPNSIIATLLGLDAKQIRIKKISEEVLYILKKENKFISLSYISDHIEKEFGSEHKDYHLREAIASLLSEETIEKRGKKRGSKYGVPGAEFTQNKNLEVNRENNWKAINDLIVWMMDEFPCFWKNLERNFVTDVEPISKLYDLGQIEKRLDPSRPYGNYWEYRIKSDVYDVWSKEGVVIPWQDPEILEKQKEEASTSSQEVSL